MSKRICWGGVGGAREVEGLVLGVGTVGRGVLVDEVVVGNFDVLIVEWRSGGRWLGRVGIGWVGGVLLRVLVRGGGRVGRYVGVHGERNVWMGTLCWSTCELESRKETAGRKDTGRGARCQREAETE